MAVLAECCSADAAKTFARFMCIGCERLIVPVRRGKSKVVIWLEICPAFEGNDAMNLKTLLGLFCSAALSFAADAPKISAQTIQEAEKILGLELTEKERDLMQRNIISRAGGYGDLRKASFPSELA